MKFLRIENKFKKRALALPPPLVFGELVRQPRINVDFDTITESRE